MKLIYPEIETTFEFVDGYFPGLILENPDLFYRLVEDLFRQTKGDEGQAILSVDNEPLPIAANLDLLTNFFPLEINRKTLVNKIVAQMEKRALSEDFYERTQELVGKIESWLNDLAYQTEVEVEFSHLSVSALLKFAGICLKEDYPTLAEKILDYMELMVKNGLAKIFVLVNFRAIVNSEILESFTDQCCRNGYRILLVDNKGYPKLSREQRVIIDNDLCEI